MYSKKYLQRGGGERPGVDGGETEQRGEPVKNPGEKGGGLKMELLSISYPNKTGREMCGKGGGNV